MAGTLVYTSDGQKPIEEIEVGDEVLSYNEETGQTEYKPVLATYVRNADRILDVSVEGEIESLGVTPEHPFFVHRARDNTSDGDSDDEDAGQWVAAGKLREGDRVLRPNGEWVRVVRIEKRPTGGRVYNFSVADNHTYFVGASGVLVHNTCPKKTLADWLDDEPELLEETRELFKNKPEWQGIDPDTTEVWYRPKNEVDLIRAKAGESGGHHPHGLALGGPEGQTLTVTNETRTVKNPDHSKATGLQKRLINVIRRKAGI